MTRTSLSSDELRDLRRRVRGAVVCPRDTLYDDARVVWNEMIDVRPAVVVRAAGVGDVAPTIAFAREYGFELAVRGGGHNVAGNGTVEGGVVLDMGGLHAVSVDPEAQTVRVEGGATLAHVDAATEEHGLVVPLGVVTGTGVAGLTLGGGVGWLTRAHGLTADNLVSVEVVTADGDLVTASESEHPELLWALRGGGGNFGVVTAFTFRAYPLGPQVFAGNFVYGRERWRDAWRGLREWTRDLPDEMTTITTTMTPPPSMQLGCEPILIVGFAWASPDHAAGEAQAGRLRTLAPPDSEAVGPTRWVDWQSALDPLIAKRVRAYWRNASFDQLDDDVIDVLIARGEEQTWVGTAFDVHHMGGAFGRIPEDAAPFPGRHSQFWINIYGFWKDPADDDARVTFVRSLAADMERFAGSGHYVNFQGREKAGHRVLDPRQVFGAHKFARLQAVKREFDPENVFHVNHNIPPG